MHVFATACWVLAQTVALSPPGAAAAQADVDIASAADPQDTGLIKGRKV